MGNYCLFRLISFHPETPDERLAVSDSERRHFSSWQGNRGVARRRTSVPPRGASRSVIETAEASAATAEGSGQVGRRSHRPRAEKDPFRTETNSWPVTRDQNAIPFYPATVYHGMTRSCKTATGSGIRSGKKKHEAGSGKRGR